VPFPHVQSLSAPEPQLRDASTREVRAALAEGRALADLGHDLAIHLFQWFPGHADYLDSALAAWMSKQVYGGKPVVLRRKL